MKSLGVSISIVTYAPDEMILSKTLGSLVNSLSYALSMGCITKGELLIVDNGPADKWAARLNTILQSDAGGRDWLKTRVISGHGNLGYGNGHNLAIQQSEADYHLILNPDVIVDDAALFEAIKFMEANADVGLLAPSVFRSDGRQQYLIKRYPSVFDLFLRGFAPGMIKNLFVKRLYKYEMRDVVGSDLLIDVPLVSGCFMLFRKTVLEDIGGFSKEYFMYFEDFDISLRVRSRSHTAYVPSVKIIHFGGNAARKGFKHIKMFIASGIIFFNKHGWRWL